MMRWISLLLMTWMLLHPAEGFAWQTVTVESGMDSGPIGLHVGYLADTTGSATIDSLLNDTAQWTPSTQRTPSFGFTAHPHWLRFRLVNDTAYDHLWLTVGYPLLNHVDIHLVRNGQRVHSANGGTLASKDDSHRSHQILFRLPVPAGEERDVYLRVQSESSLLIPLSVSEPVTRLTRDDLRLRILGMFIGALMALLAYHAVILVRFRETSLLLYIPVVLLSLTTAALLNGILDRYLLPGTDLGGYQLIPLAAAGVATFGLLLTRSFLQTRTLSRHIDRITLASALLASAIGLLSLLIPYRYGITLTSLLIPLSVVIALVASLASWRSGFKPSVYFATGWFMIVFGTIMFALRAFGLLPENTMTENFLYVALAMMMALIAMALAARLSLMRARNEAAQRALREQILSSNRKLEREVESRTRELEEQHRRLDEANRTVMLREGQIATGVMSAGLAHEINNPNNFVAVGCQVLDQRLKTFETLIQGMLDEDAPAAVKARLQQFFLEQRDSIDKIKTHSVALSDTVSRFRSVSTNDESDITLIDLMTRFQRMLSLASPGLPESLTLDVTIKDHPMMRCRAGHIIQMLLAILQWHADASRVQPRELEIIAQKDDTSLSIDFLGNTPLELSNDQIEWLGGMLSRHAATFSRHSLQRLTLRFPLEIADVT